MYMGTTNITVIKTFGEIQELLIKSGAENISILSKNKEPIGISFSLEVNHKILTFKLPCRYEKTHEKLLKENKEKRTRNLTESNKESILQQSKRTSWRIILRWLQAQFELIDTGQTKIEEIFLPYLINNHGKTLFEAIENNNYKLIEG